MIWIGRSAAGLVFLFSAAMAALTYVAPDKAQDALGFGSLSGLALNTFRADVGAFFAANAVAAGAALFAGRTSWLMAPAFIFGAAALGRLFGVVVDGAPTGVAQPIAVEMTLVVLSLLGARFLGKR